MTANEFSADIAARTDSYFNRTRRIAVRGVAIWLISPLIPPVVHLLLWSALLICSAIYLHALDPLPHGASGFRKLWKGLGVILHEPRETRAVPWLGVDGAGLALRAVPRFDRLGGLFFRASASSL